MSQKSIAIPRSAEEERIHIGTIYGFLAYGMWGVLPLYFHALAPATAWEILAHRIVWSLLLTVAIWAWKRDLSWLRPLLRNRRRLGLLGLAAFFLAINWGVYIYAVSIGNVVEGSLGYFINPLLLVLMGVLLLGERMSRLQWIALGFGTVAVAIITVDYGRPPWIALSLATSFALYGYMKKSIGAHLGALESMTVETDRPDAVRPCRYCLVPDHRHRDVSHRGSLAHDVDHGVRRRDGRAAHPLLRRREPHPAHDDGPAAVPRAGRAVHSRRAHLPRGRSRAALGRLRTRLDRFGDAIHRHVHSRAALSPRPACCLTAPKSIFTPLLYWCLTVFAIRATPDDIPTGPPRDRTDAMTIAI